MRGQSLLALLAALTLSACEPAPAVERPPPQYHADRNSMVTFTTDPDAACRPLSRPTDRRIPACEYYGALIVPNPCGQTGAYADLLCHELGHANGWVHD